MTDVSRYCVECERLQAELDALQVKFTDACFEVDRMRPVVEAACEYRDIVARYSDGISEQSTGARFGVRRAVDAYRAANGADNE